MVMVKILKVHFFFCNILFEYVKTIENFSNQLSISSSNLNLKIKQPEFNQNKLLIHMKKSCICSKTFDFRK